MARHIDAEKLLNELQKRYESALSWYDNVNDPELKIRAEQAVASFLESILTIKNQPTADLQEVKHAFWSTKRTIVHDGETYCSECEYETKRRTTYCPNCGAKMDGKEN